VKVLRWDPADAGTAAQLYAVRRAAHLCDEPIEPPKSLATFGGILTGDWPGAQYEVWYVPGEAGEVVAFYGLTLPDQENKDRAGCVLFVDPGHRRRGIGRELAGHALKRAAANGRAIAESYALEESPGDAFATHLEARVAIEEARRVQELEKIEPGRIAAVRAEAAGAAAGYSLVTWTGPVPDEYLAGVAEVFNAFADAPHGEGVEPEVWDASRVRERTGKLLRSGALRGYSVAAVHDASGEMAAITEVSIDPLEPSWAYQQLTAVTRPHRGHRLGLLVKTAMLRWLAEAEPGLRRITTGNAVSNQHMIAVNETLGYRLVRPGYRFYELPTGA
jgi:RimJ/RimL family protein N-acetyltransferase